MNAFLRTITLLSVMMLPAAASLLARKMTYVNTVRPEVIVTANPGCMIQLQAGVERFGNGQQVKHVVEVLDAAYGSA